MYKYCLTRSPNMIALGLFTCALLPPPRIAVVGAQGRLGRELVQQSLSRGWSTVAVVRRPWDPVFRPVRRGGLSPDAHDSARVIPMQSRGLSVQSSLDDCPRCEAVVIAIGEGPFHQDDGAKTVRRICATLPETCSHVCLVSAYGVADSLKGSGIGIKVMSAAYLRSNYASKAEQERIVSSCRADQTLIVRPRALVHRSGMPLIGPSRRELASEILDWVGDGVLKTSDVAR